MVLTLKELKEKAIKKGIRLDQQNKSLPLKSWQLESVLFKKKESSKKAKEKRIISTPTQQCSNSVTTPTQQCSNSVTTPTQQCSNSVTTPTQQCSNSVTLSEKQLIIYKYLKSKGLKGITNKMRLSRETGIAYGTLRDIFRKFNKLNVVKIDYDITIKCHIYLINPSCIINNESYELLQNSLNNTATKTKNTFQQSTEYCWDTVGNCPPSSSSSFLKKTTTTEDVNITNTIIMELNKPELAYWRNKGLQPKQVLEWIKLVNCNEKELCRFLCYCSFEMLDLGFEESKPVDNVLNWFYKILSKTGGYPKPKGYKSFREKRVEEAREELETEKRLAEEERKIFEEKQKVVFEARFWQMMNNPESELYKTCFSRIGSMWQKIGIESGVKSPLFLAAMRKKFKELEEKTKEE